MKKIYLLIPLLALLAFGLGYGGFARQRQREEAELKARADADHAAALRQEAAEGEQAVRAALAAQAQHKQQLAEQAARDHADQAARQAALTARDEARDETARLTREADQLRRDLTDSQAALTALQRKLAETRDEQAFLQRFNAQAEANRRNLEGVLRKLAAPATAAAPAAQP